jgi:hypothetical protein
LFDPVAYKQSTQEQWQETAEAWDRWGPTLERWLGPATELMLDQARVGPGARGSARRTGALREHGRVRPLRTRVIGALHAMLAGLGPADGKQAWREIETELRPFERSDGFEGRASS